MPWAVWRGLTLGELPCATTYFCMNPHSWRLNAGSSPTMTFCASLQENAFRQMD